VSAKKVLLEFDFKALSEYKRLLMPSAIMTKTQILTEIAA